MDENLVILTGRLTRDPQVRYTQGGTAVVEFGIASNRSWRDKQSGEKKDAPVFVDCTAWAKTAELIGEHLGKGDRCLVRGRLELDQWTDKESGQKRSRLKVVAESVTFMGGKGGERRQSSEQGTGDYDRAASFEPGDSLGIPDSDPPF